jgi:hypothetical protein
MTTVHPMNQNIYSVDEASYLFSVVSIATSVIWFQNAIVSFKIQEKLFSTFPATETHSRLPVSQFCTENYFHSTLRQSSP